MLAIIEIGGNQFVVKKWDIIDVKKQDLEIKSTVLVDVLLISDDEGEETKIGSPFVEWSKVKLKVLEQFRWEKLRVFKMKSKKRYMKNCGFKSHLTKMEVLSIECPKKIESK